MTFEKPEGVEGRVEITKKRWFLLFSWEERIVVQGTLRHIRQVLGKLLGLDMEEQLEMVVPPETEEAKEK